MVKAFKSLSDKVKSISDKIKSEIVEETPNRGFIKEVAIAMNCTIIVGNMKTYNSYKSIGISDVVVISNLDSAFTFEDVCNAIIDSSVSSECVDYICKLENVNVKYIM